MTKLYIPIGIPGCGKSHLANQMIAAGVIPKEAVVSSDALRVLLTGDVNNMAINFTMFSLAHQITSIRLRHSQDVYFDATNLVAKDLKTVARLGRDHEVVLILSDTPDEVSLNRNARRERVVPEHVTRRFIERQKNLDIQKIIREITSEGIVTTVTPMSALLERSSDVIFDQLFPPDTEPLPEPLRSVLTGAQTAEQLVPQEDPNGPETGLQEEN